MTQPIVGVIWNKWVIVSGSNNLSFISEVHLAIRRTSERLELTGTLRCVMTTAVSFPLTAIAVTPAPEIALNAYSTVSFNRVREPSQLTDLI